MRARATAVITAALALPALAACGSSSSSTAASSPSASTSPGQPITVFAAASLKEAFTTLGKQFEAAHPGAKITFNFGPSSGLAEQIDNDAPADVFASASKKNMDQVVKAGHAKDPTTFAKNVGEIAVPTDNPAHIGGVADLAKSGVKVAVCQAQVPCGVIAAAIFGKAKATVKPVTQATDVRAVLTAVQTGEVDVGIVYVTDVRSAKGKVTGIEIPASLNTSTSYPIASLGDSPKATAKDFVAYVVSAVGRKVLTADGFESP